MAEVPVHKSFGEFYRFCGVTPNLELLNARWKAVLATLSANNLPQLLDFVRFLFGLRGTADTTIADLRDKCLAADPSFPTQDAELELKAIAGIALLQTMDSGGQFSDAISLAIVAGECKGHRTLAPFSALVERASAEIATRGIAIRERTPLALSALAPAKKSLEELKKVTVDPTAIRDAAAVAIQEAVTNIARLHEILKTVVDDAEDAFDILAEETNILWWVLGEASSELHQPLSSLGAPTAALAIAKELAGLTCRAPGPKASASFLARQLNLSKVSAPASLSDAVCSMSPAWREGLMKAYPQSALDLCPVAQAIVKSTETDPSTAWHAAFQKTTHLSATISFEPIRLSEQLYDELMFLNALPKS